ncbi:hypothetical protein MXB_3573 [Myxobolus squamalis]|nr:hypothetical protein MXB_3573 [Myxobolus squamalis]
MNWSINCEMICRALTNCARFAHTFNFHLDAYGKECFSEIVYAKEKFEIIYEVISGGFMDIDLNIFGPTNQIIQSIQRRPNGHYIVNANQLGNYEFCFSNDHSSMTNKVVVFHIIHDTQQTEQPTTNISVDANSPTKKLEKATFNLISKVVDMRRGQEFLNLRDQTHARLNLESHSYITYWAVFECLIFIGVTLCQIWYLKRFFEVRRVI